MNGKRVFMIVIVAVLLLCASAHAEKKILFRKVAWDVNVTTAKALWNVDGYSSNLENTYLGYEDNYLDAYPSANYTTIPSGHVVFSYVSGLQVAGYDVECVNMYFRYGDEGDITALENAQLCAASYSFQNIVDISGAYDDLREKLCALYGTPKDTSEEKSGAQYGSDGTQEYKGLKRTSVWQDEYGAKVYLISMISDNPNVLFTNYIYMVYLEPDYDKKLEHTESVAKTYAIQLENENRSTSIDGL